MHQLCLCPVFPSQEQEAAQLQRLEPGQLLEFARSVLVNRSTRRKAIVAVKGASELLADKAPAGPPPALANGTAGGQSDSAGLNGGSTAALPAVAPAADECPVASVSSGAAVSSRGTENGTGGQSSSSTHTSDGEVLVRVAVSDLAEFKRGLEVWPSVGGLYAQRRRKQAGASKL